MVAILYAVLTLGGPASATPGMRFMGIEMRTLRGGHMDYGLALLHALGFWFSVAILTPLILIVALFTARKQLLHDLVLGTIAIRAR
ncbi:MAG: RDD family protein [Propylenella sp.]